ncbi:PAS domain-containing hybrid sensor histidine kinase/response regulator [Oceanimonas pelagia]|uniref:histidine kinase n=1 Tax=Oceanimonas pelagia TaxID=3028314 RepID=A0AA50KPL3_9GAMM|nr:PAS domain-containing hybrid sensor histidine kinase/response regulator [Oceanimonas pelagia]WMC11299.1 PAS domain-containing hybrid sensor histidine kinase/response regulator [Oceanimonas pelagia]
MMQGWTVINIALAYLGVLFLLAWLGDQPRMGNRIRRFRPLLYSLSLAVYCTSWSFFGTVGQASTDGWTYFTIYLGPILMFTLGGRFIARLIDVAKREHITSIADFIAARYGKSQRLAVFITLIAIVGVLPYIALQLKAIVMGLNLMAPDVVAGAGRNAGEVALMVTLLFTLFILLFGTRHIDATEHQRGVMVAIAAESVVKLVAFIVVGGFALWLILAFPNQQRVMVTEDFIRSLSVVSGGHLLDIGVYTLLSMSAIICLPRQFHVAVVEHHGPADLRWARRIFPVYLLLFGLLVLPLSLAGQQWLSAGTSPDTYVISLPLDLGHPNLAMLAFIGGASAATGMMIISTIALAIMISNDLVLPMILRRRQLQGAGFEDVAQLLLNVRRTAIMVIMATAWLVFLWLGDISSLSRIGYLSFAAIAQFAPALVLGLLWRGGNRRGAYWGLSLGMLMWLLNLMAETGLFAGDASTNVVLWLLTPPTVGWLAEMSPVTWGILLSLLCNLAGYLAGSWLSVPSVSERFQAAAFVGRPHKDDDDVYRAKVTVRDLEQLASRFVGEARVKRAFARYAGEQGTLEGSMQAPASLIRHTERVLAGVFGTSSARLVLASAVQGRSMELDELATIVDEAGDVFRFNRGLLQGAIEHISLGISVVDKELRLVAWNRRYLELFQYPPGLIRVGRPIADIIRHNAGQGLCGPGDVDQHVSRRVAFMKAGSRHVSARTRPDGRVIEVQGNPMPGGGFVMTFNDITTFRQAEQVLKDANVMLEQRVAERTRELSTVNEQLLAANRQAELANASKSRFLAAVSHDLMQPLNAAKLFASSWLETSSDDESRRLAGHIDRSLTAAEELIGDLLDMSRLESGKLTAKPQDFAIEELFDTLKAEFGVLAEQQGGAFSVVGSRLGVHSDPRLLRRILQNFLTNALRYSAGGHIVLGLRRAGEQVRIEVWDNGPGIPADKLDLIFDEFTRLEAGQRHQQGLGLGLAIAQGLAGILGHRLGVRSREGRGSVFSITLPRAHRPPGAGVPVPVAVAGGGNRLAGLKILCIDNEADILTAMNSLLGRWGCEVRLAGGGDEARALCRDGFSPQVILSDYHLDDGENGVSAINMLRLEFGRIPAVVISADRQPELQQQLQQQDLGYLSKPVKPLKLRALLQHLVKGG